MEREEVGAIGNRYRKIIHAVRRVRRTAIVPGRIVNTAWWLAKFRLPRCGRTVQPRKPSHQ